MALVENRRLQAALNRQLETARALVEALAGLSVEALGIDLFSVAREMAPPTSPREQGSLRAAWLLAEVKRAYDEIDGVLEPVNLQQCRKPPTTGCFRRVVDGQDELVLETRDTITIQLDFDRFTMALWQAILRSPWDGFKKEYEDSTMPDCVEFQVRFDGLVQGQRLDLLATIVIMRYVREDHVAIVWASMTCIENNDQFAEVFVEDTGYSRMTRVSHPLTGAEMVYKQNCIVSVPRSTAKTSAVQYPHTGAFTNLVLSAASANIASVDEMVENMMIEAFMKDVEEL